MKLPYIIHKKKLKLNLVVKYSKTSKKNLSGFNNNKNTQKVLK